MNITTPEHLRRLADDMAQLAESFGHRRLSDATEAFLAAADLIGRYDALRKPLEYRLVDLLRESECGPEQQAAVWTLLQFISDKHVPPGAALVEEQEVAHG